MTKKIATTPVTAPAWTVNRSSLLAALKLTGTVVKRDQIATLEHVLLTSVDTLDSIELAGTNLQETIVAGVEASGPGPLFACLPHNLLLGLIASDSAETVTLSMDGFSARILGSGKYTIPGLDPKDYPKLPSVSEVKDWGELPLPGLSAALSNGWHAAEGSKAKYSASTEVNASLIKATKNSLIFWTTNGHRVWHEEFPCKAIMPKGSPELSIAIEAFSPIASLEGKTIKVGWGKEERHLIFLTENGTMLAFRRAEGKHPNYEDTMKRFVLADNECQISAKELKAAAERAMMVSQVNKIRLEVKEDGSLDVWWEGGMGSCNSSLGIVNVVGKPWRKQINGKYLTEALSSLDSGEIILATGDDDTESDPPNIRPLRLTPAGNEKNSWKKMSVIMPQVWD